MPLLFSEWFVPGPNRSRLVSIRPTKFSNRSLFGWYCVSISRTARVFFHRALIGTGCAPLNVYVRSAAARGARPFSRELPCTLRPGKTHGMWRMWYALIRPARDTRGHTTSTFSPVSTPCSLFSGPGSFRRCCRSNGWLAFRASESPSGTDYLSL